MNSKLFCGVESVATNTFNFFVGHSGFGLPPSFHRIPQKGKQSDTIWYYNYSLTYQWMCKGDHLVLWSQSVLNLNINMIIGQSILQGAVFNCFRIQFLS